MNPQDIRTPLTVVALAVTALVCLSARAEEPQKTPTAPAAKDLFDGKTLAGWKATEFGGEGKVEVKNGTIVLETGKPMTGITFAGKPPRTNFELSLEGMRLEGQDFFCTTTFPVGDSHCSFVVGGWGGSLVGLSSIDFLDASENATTATYEFKDKKWYRIRIRVTEAAIETWIDDKRIVLQERKDHKFSVRMECDPSRPLGISSYYAKAALRNIRLRELTAAEAAAKPQKDE